MSSATGEPSRLPPFVIAIKSLHEAGACLTLTLTNPLPTLTLTLNPNPKP